jgi:glutamate dehydrogenase (NADP+)
MADDKKYLTVALQGFGNAGAQLAQLAQLLADNGYCVVSVSDSKGGVYDPDGLDIDRLRKGKENSRSLRDVYCRDSVCDIDGLKILSNEELLTLDVDVLIPVALENQITADNVAAIRAAIIFEVANGPVTAEAAAILDKQGITIVPDILCNAGGVIVSYFEWLQNRSGAYWDLEQVQQQLQQKILTQTDAVWEKAAQRKINLRTAAYILALEQIDAAIAIKGPG